MISVLMPTRGRLDLAARAQKSIKDNNAGRVELLMYVDNDDNTDYEQLDRKDGLLRTKVFRSDPKTVGKAWNDLYACSKGDLIMMGNDDLVWKTPGWDLMVEEVYQRKFPDNLGVMWCDDGSGRGGLPCCFPIVSKLWCSALGQFTPEHFHFLWNDTWIHDVGVKAGLTHYLPFVLIEHRHFTHQKADYDETYRRHREGLNACRKRQEDQAEFRATEPERLAQARRIQSLVGAGKVTV